jgi:uncharacterized membrane protein
VRTNRFDSILHAPVVSQTVLGLLILLWFSMLETVFAHQSSDGFLAITVSNQVATVRLDLALRDLDAVLWLDANDGGNITWGELKSQRSAIKSYVTPRLNLAINGSELPASEPNLAVVDHADGTYAVLEWNAAVPDPVHEITVNYQLFFEIDRDHRGLIKVSSPEGGLSQSVILAPDHSTETFHCRRAHHITGFQYFIKEGIHHIWTGYDHLLFLISLLLPSVLCLPRGRVQGDSHRFRGVVAVVLRVVSAFTLAHSITLALAAFEWVRLPSRMVESVIAASVVIVAVNNLVPVFNDRGPTVAFVFGLVHGFGFAAVLGDLELKSAELLRGLIGFNLGVEIGQVVIVLLFLPVAYWCREFWIYRRVAVQMGSAVISLLAGGWLVERAFEIRFMPF